MGSVLYGAIVALYAGLGGAFLAYLCLAQHPGWAILLVVIIGGIGHGCDKLGESCFWRRPRTALLLKEVWILLPATVAAAATCILILFKQELSAWPIFGPVDTAKDQNALISGPVSDAVVAFVGAIILKAASDADGEWLAPRIAAAFADHYKRGVPAQTTDEVYLYDDYEGVNAPLDLAVSSDDAPGGLSGWGLAARWARAGVIAGRLPKA
ncbi:hypothetical protein [Labrys wisconsinensis]|uniref:Uncharacterized protein n=1 Tax=Labrys wisconsinensis TaxID=425677 RepID=A0ABU0JKM1_9HYPH|nr:hypothetical protein [Labrys wisconsinensis]MDQ0474830.1 hypothetical protein [Labrys wisconsinensis]